MSPLSRVPLIRSPYGRSVVPSGNSYTTGFAGGDENPLNEGGRWFNGAADGIDWGNMRIVGGKAVGTIATTFHDNTGILKGVWAPNQRAQATIFKGSPNNTFAPEAELRLRSSISAHDCHGYEIGYSLRGGSDSYLIIVRWNGPVGSPDGFTYILSADQANGVAYEVGDGAVISASIVGNIITTSVDGVQKASVDVRGAGPAWTDGAPGIGTNGDTGGLATIGEYGFRAFSATDL
jgi:hypothetical protein